MEKIWTALHNNFFSSPAALLQALCTLSLFGLPCRASAASITLIPHKAEYKLTASQIREGNIVNATGTLSYEILDGCTGWATQQKLRLTTYSRLGKIATISSSSANWENKDGRFFSFLNMQQQDNTPRHLMGGRAVMGKKGGYAIFDTSNFLRLQLPQNTLFPTHHTQTLLAWASHASYGTPLSLMLFDGTSVEGSVQTFITFFKNHEEGSLPVSLSSSATVHDVGISFYSSNPTFLLPDYESHIHYLDNSIIPELDLDFPTFSMHATLQKLVLKKDSSCS